MENFKAFVLLTINLNKRSTYFHYLCQYCVLLCASILKPLLTALCLQLQNSYLFFKELKNLVHFLSKLTQNTTLLIFTFLYLKTKIKFVFSRRTAFFFFKSRCKQCSLVLLWNNLILIESDNYLPCICKFHLHQKDLEHLCSYSSCQAQHWRKDFQTV